MINSEGPRWLVRASGSYPGYLFGLVKGYEPEARTSKRKSSSMLILKILGGAKGTYFRFFRNQSFFFLKISRTFKLGNRSVLSKEFLALKAYRFLFFRA